MKTPHDSGALPPTRRSGLRAACLGLLFLVASGAGAQTPLTLTLDRSVELALEHNHELLATRQEGERAEARIAEARSAAYPGLGLDLTYNHSWIQSQATFTVEGEDEEGNPVKQTQTVTMGQPNHMSAGISLQQTLYAGGKVRHGLKAAEVYAEQAQTNNRTAEQGISYQVQRLFLGALMAREAIEVARLALEQAQAHQEQVARRFEKGNASEFDLLRSQVETANLQPPLIEARNNYKRSLEQLKSAIGLEMSLQIAVEGDLQGLSESLAARILPLLSLPSSPATDFLPLDPDRLVDLGLRHRAEIRSLDLQAALLEQQLAVDRGDRRPSLALVGQYQWAWQLPNELRAKEEDLTDSWSTGLSLKLPLFDGGRTRAKLAQTRAQMRQVAIRRQQLADRIGLEIRNALLDLQEAREKIRAQRQTLLQAERGLAIAEVRFRGGMATQLEVLDAQLALTATRTQQIHALHDYAVALAALGYATGHSTQATHL